MEDQPPDVIVDAATNGHLLPSRAVRRAAERQAQDANRTQRSEHLRRLTYLQGPVSRQEAIDAFGKIEREHQDEVKKYKDAWEDMRTAFNHLSIQHTALMRAVFAKRTWGRQLLSELDYQRALTEVEVELRASAQTAATPEPPR